jgi:hypothetical protein
MSDDELQLGEEELTGCLGGCKLKALKSSVRTDLRKRDSARTAIRQQLPTAGKPRELCLLTTGGLDGSYWN